jgi:hypothetical protein
MNLGEKIKEILSFIKENNTKNYSIKEFYTTSEDQHKTINEYVFGTENGVAEKMLNAYLKCFEEYGECAGSDPKGQWIVITDFELL